MNRFVFLFCLTMQVGGGLLVLSGCGSDPVAPQESISMTIDEAAVHAALISFGMVRLFPEFLYYQPPPPPKTARVDCDSLYLIEGEDINGAVTISFRSAAGEAVCSYDDRPDFGHMVTRAGQQVQALIPGADPGLKDRVVVLTFDIDADFFRTTTAISGSGVLVAGSLTTRFTVTAATIVNAEQPPNYPVAGNISFLIGGTPAEVTFLGGEEQVNLTIGLRQWKVFLDNGAIEEIPVAAAPVPLELSLN